MEELASARHRFLGEASNLGGGIRLFGPEDEPGEPHLATQPLEGRGPLFG